MSLLTLLATGIIHKYTIARFYKFEHHCCTYRKQFPNNNKLVHNITQIAVGLYMYNVQQRKKNL